MSIDIGCVEECYSCSYSYWNTIRTDVIMATFDYLIVHLSLKDLDEESLTETIYRKEMLDFIEYFIKFKKKYDTIDIYEVNLFLTLCDSNKLKYLIFYGVSGLYSFCNKNSECDSYYTVGNSYDVCELFILIKPFLIKNRENIESSENDTFNSIIKIEKIFKESVEKNKIVKFN
jgi:hypothetical protein